MADNEFITFQDNSQRFPWMDQEFFEMVIRQYTKDINAIVSNYKVTPGSNPGENYATVVFRCVIEFSSKHHNDKTLSVIMKTVPDKDNLKKQMLEANRTFETEIAMYDKVLPKFKQLWESFGDNSSIFPELIYQSESPRLVLILEDMCAKGYKIGDQPPSDYESSKFLVQKLAKFHATSFYLVNDKNMDLSQFDLCMYKFMPSVVRNLHFGQSIEVFIEVLKSWDEFESYMPNLESIPNNYLTKIKNVYKPNEFYNVLNHSDHHPKNEMFLMENGKLKNVCFLDFQIPVLASPAIDLIYSLYVDLSTENRAKYREDYIMYYHSEFVKALKSYGYLKKIPSLLDLRLELLKCGFLETIMIICLILFSFIDWSECDPTDMNNPAVLKRLKTKCYNNPKYRTIIEQELPRLFLKGLL